MKIVLATSNPHKVEEINAITKNIGIEFVLPPESFNPIEDGETFEQNALIKAQEAAKISNSISLADDSGLCVDALDGGPGIHSARYADTPQGRIDKLLSALKCIATEDRSAKFVCAMSLVDSEGNELFSCRGECFGSIAEHSKGLNGFGYDPIFILKEKGLTMAELSEADKNLISHRAKALTQVLAYITKNFLG